MEAEFDDVPAWNCDIPGTSDVVREVVWKIRARKRSS